MSKFNEFREKQDEINALGYALNHISWDQATEAKSGSNEYRNKQVGILSKKQFELVIEPSRIELIRELRNDASLSEEETREIYLASRQIDSLEKVPANLYSEYQVLLSRAQGIWENAYIEKNYSMFKDTLKEIIEKTNEVLEYRNDGSRSNYDILLDDFEEGMTSEKYDEFFDLLKEQLVPFVKQITSKEVIYNDDFIKNNFSEKGQKEFAEYLMDVFNFDRERGLLKESVHPFTWNTHSQDVRLTVRYIEDLMTSSIFSAAHELGHALYEQQIDSKYDGTYLSGGTSMGFHESQSRFYENMIGRSRVFWKAHFDKLKEIFKEELAGVTMDDFYKFVNKVELSYIRVEADELTYPLHIMIRYEIEKEIFNGEVDIDKLDERWNELTKEYLGLDVTNDSEGILQDVHFSAGLFGYFPTYALGSAIAAQIYNTMEKEICIYDIVKSGNLEPINTWLKTHAHKYGSFKTSNEILAEMTGEPFNPEYYTKYLINKYLELFI